MKQQISFKWNAEVVKSSNCNHEHFLYISSVCIEKINIKSIQQTNHHKECLNKAKILCYLHDVGMDGTIFSLITSDIFVRSTKYLMGSIKSEENAELLFQTITDFDCTDIPVDTQCSI